MHSSLLTIALFASLGLTQGPSPTRLFSNPVQPTAVSDDPALTTTRSLTIITPSISASTSESASGSASLTTESTSTAAAQPSVSGSHGPSSESSNPALTTITGTHTVSSSSSQQASASPTTTSNPGNMPTAFANAAAGLIAVVGLAIAL